MQLMVFDRMEQCTEAEVQAMLPLVSEQRREQALRYKHTFGQFCCLKSWLMLSAIIGEGLPVSAYGNWEYNEHGKPFFPYNLSPVTHQPCYFSISHCKHAIAVAVDTQPVGVDVESIRHADQDLIIRVMRTREQQDIAEAADPDRAFTRLWTEKEAVVKWRGTGIESFEQLQYLLLPAFDRDINMPGIIQTYEKENYIYSIAYGK